jgi:hypothetical protein
MASGDLTASTPSVVNNIPATIKTTIDALNLAATTDRLVVIPVENNHKVMIFKVERAA